ncbi:MAG: DUF4136 domain-containing protein [Calditrichia bacterium]
MNSKVKLVSSLIFLISAGVLVFTACYPDYGLSVADYDTVLTRYDRNVNFDLFSSYAMPDTVLHLVPEGEKDDLTREYDNLVLTEVANQMATLGYTRVTDTTQSVDIIVLVSAAKSEWRVLDYYPPGSGWWGWYPWYPGGGWYPWYPGYIGEYKFATGSIFLSIIDSESSEENVIPLWGAFLNGLANSDTPSGVRQRIRSGINQAFAQSAYLKTN